MAKEWTEEERKAFGEKMKAAKAAKIDPEVKKETEVAPDQSIEDLKRQLQETNETLALMKQAFLNNQPAQSGVQIGHKGGVIGVVEKYLVDPTAYPDPSERLAAESRLATIAFPYNYELKYNVAVSSYETKEGINYKEPKFMLTLAKVVMDDEGSPTDKRYVVRRMVFHEDPQAALVIARDNGIEIDDSEEKHFLDEMRYLRARDWLFDIFWPKPINPASQLREEVIGGTVVEVFTVNKPEAEGTPNLPFDQLKKAQY